MFLGAHGKGRGWKKSDINVLHLRGAYAEMAAQHGAILKEAVRGGAAVYLGGKNERMIRQAPMLRDSRIKQTMLLGLMKLLQMPMRARIPREYRRESRGLAKSAGLNAELFEQTSLQADSLVLLLRHSMGRYLLKHMSPNGAFPGLPGCTSIVALKEHTAAGSLLQARNMDYPSVGTWDANPTVFYCDPDGGQRSVGITTAGVHSVGITSVNESGLALAAHFHCSRRVSFFGTPVHIIGSEIMRRARTLSQAINIARSIDRAGSWSFVISSARENKACVIEMASGRLEVRDADDSNGLLAHTNYFRTHSMREDEILLSMSTLHDFEARYARALELLRDAAHGGALTPAACGRILADGLDREVGQVRGQGYTIAVITTVTSIIAELGNNRFWVAHRPESPVCLGNYSGFRLDEDFRNFDERSLETMDWTASPGPATASSVRGTAKQDALSAFRSAYMAFHNDFDTVATLTHLSRAVELDPKEGNYWIAMGHLQMRLRRHENALQSFLMGEACPLGLHMKQTLLLFLGHAHDALGRRDEALARYRALEQEKPLSPHIREELQKNLKAPYKADRAEDITFDFQYCDSMEYA